MIRCIPSLAGVVLLASACLPPDLGAVTTGEPAIHLVHPAPGTRTIPLRADGRLSLLVAVDLDGIDFRPDLKDETPTDGQGHWHVLLNEQYLGAPDAQFFRVLSQPDEFTVGQQMNLTVAIAQNDHTLLGPQDVLEFAIGEPEADTGLTTAVP